MCWTRVRKSRHPFDTPPSTEFLPAWVPIVIKIPLGKTQKRSRLGSEILGEGGTRDSWEASKPGPPGWPSCFKVWAVRISGSGMSLFSVPQEELGRPPLTLPNPQLLPKAACPGCRHGIMTIISIRATMPLTAAAESALSTRRCFQGSSHVPAVILSKALWSSRFFLNVLIYLASS